MPFIPFIYGVVVGSAVTYVLKDEPSKEMVKETGGKIAGGVSALSGKVTGLFKKKEATEEAAGDEVDAEDAVTA